jgi:hypothetical protein
MKSPSLMIWKEGVLSLMAAKKGALFDDLERKRHVGSPAKVALSDDLERKRHVGSPGMKSPSLMIWKEGVTSDRLE